MWDVCSSEFLDLYINWNVFDNLSKYLTRVTRDLLWRPASSLCLANLNLNNWCSTQLEIFFYLEKLKEYSKIYLASLIIFILNLCMFCFVLFFFECIDVKWFKANIVKTNIGYNKSYLCYINIINATEKLGVIIPS